MDKTREKNKKKIHSLELLRTCLVRTLTKNAWQVSLPEIFPRMCLVQTLRLLPDCSCLDVLPGASPSKSIAWDLLGVAWLQLMLTDTFSTSIDTSKLNQTTLTPLAIQAMYQVTNQMVLRI